MGQTNFGTFELKSSQQKLIHRQTPQLESLSQSFRQPVYSTISYTTKANIFCYNIP